MKRMIFAAFVLAGALSFAGCNKGEMASPASSAAEKGIAPSVITYKMMIEPPVSIAPFQWSTGYFATDALSFEGTPQIGDLVDLRKFETNNNVALKLYIPTVLGSVNVTPGIFNYGMFMVQLDPVNSSPDLFLSGTYTDMNGNKTPVQVSINSPVVLNTRWMSNVSITYRDNYTATVYLGLGAVTNNIDDNLMAKAERTNGIVMVSNTMNANLYQIILTNLQTNILEALLSATNLDNTIPIAAEPPTS